MNNGDYNLLYYTNNLKTKRTSRDPNLRNNCISVRFNDEELKILNFKRGERSKAEWLRLIALEKIPPTVPSINNETWKVLSEISQKLKRITIHIDGKSKDSQLTHTELFAVRRLIKELRHHLINADIWSNPDEGYAEDQKG
ncbi:MULTISPECIES: hypothetical protein [Enterobacterales]|uniref:hypothetical protein n=1 Tax=Enterobacterales TaxID=91347 RepID=UPI0007933268|nr:MULTISPECIES: hypothetical protein [Enterobacterales]HDT5965846.1 hypothetical protein [Raoultella ornithinolytica]MBQ4658056.1 hypothetical protein [Klebsiella michiganensis]MBQ4664137.1 hypothetical protein [Klebsiella michiganensis]MBX8630283.1 hypothetical protein [Enterobacter hormaechei]MBY5192564.1 hypothetical protein [Escherichia coli]